MNFRPFAFSLPEMKTLTNILFLVAAFSGWLDAQPAFFSATFQDEIPRQDSFAACLQAAFERDCSALAAKQFKKDVHAFILEKYAGRFQELKGGLEAGYFLSQPEIDAYLQGILAEICQSNSDIPKDRIRLFLSKDPSPNASSVGEGSILLNVGLLPALENESQLAAVLCHEIAHFTLDHANVSIEKSALQLFDRQTKRELNKPTGNLYASKQRRLRFLKSLAFERRRYDREQEKQADELGLRYLLNTRYNAVQVLRALTLSDSAGAEAAGLQIPFEHVFGTPEFPFQPKWLAQEDLMNLNYQKDDPDADSLSTHPAYEQRIEGLKHLIAQQNQGVDNLQNLPFQVVADACELEIPRSYFFFEDYGTCLYESLKLLEKHPRHATLHGLMGRCFFEIYQLTQAHKLSSAVEMPAAGQPPQYRQVLQFIHNLRLAELANLNYHFLKKNKDLFLDDEEFLFAWIQANDLVKRTADADDLRQRYKTRFPAGKYLVELGMD